MIIHSIVDPLLVILGNQEFVFLFWIAIPLGIWMAFRKAVSPAVRHAVIVFGGVACSGSYAPALHTICCHSTHAIS